MTLPFNEEIINDGFMDYESLKYPNFVGFLNPYGIPIEFRDKFGYTGHGQIPSVQERFRVYYILKIRDYEGMSPLENITMNKRYLRSEKAKYSNSLKKLIVSLKQDLLFYQNLSTSLEMEIDIYDFLLNCYSADTFFDGIGNIETCMCEKEFYNQEYKNKNLYDINHYDFKLEYNLYKDKILMDIFKNVMIQYLGYHSVERTPKTITTSSFRIYETFYNYLLNDFTIFQIPKMIFDSKEKKYVQQNFNEFFIPDSEIRLRDEIQAIKKLVPITERTKYYK